MTNRVKVNYPNKTPEAAHYFALVVSNPSYSTWDHRNHTNFSKKFSLACKARGIIEYDRVLNSEMMMHHFVKFFNKNLR